MPLTGVVDGLREQIRRFLNDRDAATLYVVAAPEAEPMAAKLIGSIEAEPDSDDIVLAHTGPFPDPVSYYRAAVATFLENFAEHREALIKEQVFFVMPAGLDEQYRIPGVPIEALFADFAERCARAFYQSVARRLVFLLRAEEPRDEQAFLASSALLASLSAAERTKFISFTVPAGSAPQAVAAPQRLNVIEPRTGQELGVTVRAFLGAVARRVLVVRTTAVRDDWARHEIETLLDERRRPRFHVSLERGTPANVVAIAIDNLREQARARGLPTEPADLTLELADRLAAFCETLARAISEERGELVIILSFSSWTQEELELGRALILGLRTGACSPRVRYVILDALGCLPPLEERPRPVPELNVKVEVGAIEAGLLSKLKLPDLPVPERINCLQGLASISSARQQHETALTLLDQALGWAEQVNDPPTTFKLWLGIGHALYRSQSWQAAEAAYSKALNIALDASLVAAIAESTMHLGNTLLCSNKHQESITCYQSASDWYDKLAIPLLALHARTWLGEARLRSGDLRGAEECWDAVLQGYQRLGDDFRDMTLEGKKQVLGRLVRLHQRTNNRALSTRRQAELDALGAPPIITEQP
jgi:tetratricopeptide (TPR) repeat protein